MPQFDWDHLQAFLAVARTGRLTVAARRAGVDHATLSRRIASLEAALGVPLFERRTAGYALTPEGERLLPDAEAMESLALRIAARRDDPLQGLSGTVRIGTPEAFGTYFLAPRLARLAERHPQLDIELVANPRAFSLSRREADIAVSMARPEQGRLHARPLADYESGVYASRDYVERYGLTGEVPADRHDWARHAWVGYVEDLMWTPELNYLSQVSTAIAPRLRISNVISQCAAVAGGAGLGVLPCFVARHEPGLVRLAARDLCIFRSYWLVTHADTHDLARIRAVADFIAGAIRAEPAFWAMQA